MAVLNEFKYEILPDGQLKIDVDGISPEAHMQADQLMKFLRESMGGDVIEQKKKTAHTHVHEHEHQRQRG